MPQLLLELFSEEIPARMQKRAEEDLSKLLTQKLEAAGLTPGVIRPFSSPRHLGVVIESLDARTADVKEEKKGPRVGAPEQALQGFLKSAGLSSIDQAEIVSDKKGDFYVAKIERAGRETVEVLKEAVPEIIRAFPWPKSMRSGTSDLQWVRPLHNILCVFGAEHVEINIEGVHTKAVTWGHRFHAPDEIKIKDAGEHYAKLREAHVLVDRDERKAIILEQARKACAERKLELVEDQGLLEEVTGLVEWPVALLGRMDPDFLSLPAEVIRLTMRTHQKYFAVRDPQTGKLAPHFVTIANISAKDGGDAIAKGNARVLSARLNDARFFWDGDKKTPLFTEERKAKLQKIVFHQKLGSVWDKVERVKALAGELCAVTGADKALVERAADLMKCDLVTETVGEFPELQGQIGRQLYLDEQGANESVAAAIEDHYRPLGPNDRVPTDKVAITLALADKLDTLVGFWAIDEKPTGSSDPYALRRAALGFASIVLKNGVRLELSKGIDWSLNSIPGSAESLIATGVDLHLDLQKFLADRLKVQLRDQGKRHDLVDAVFALGDDDLVRIVARVEALDGFLKTEDGKNLLAGFKRAANILAAEEKKDAISADDKAAMAAGAVDQSLLEAAEEKALLAALTKTAEEAERAAAKEDFAGAMAALAKLRSPVDAFFDKVLVNAENAMLRRNRLVLLSLIRGALLRVADFGKIEG